MTVSIQTLPPQVQQRYNEKLLSTPEKNLIFGLGAVPVVFPNNAGFIDRQSRYDALSTFEIPLDDAQLNPPEQSLSRVDVDCRLRNYATYIVLTKDVTLTNEDPVLNSAVARLGQALRETQDVLLRDVLEATASIVNCVGGSNGDVPSEMAVSDVDDIVALLQGNAGEYITNMIGAENRIGTSPVGDSYLCLCHTRMIPVLNNMSGFIRKFQYPNIDKTLSSEWGGVNNVRFFISSQGSITSGASMLGNDIANCFVVAKEGYKVVWREGHQGQFHYLPPGYNNDPCFLRKTAGCSFYQGEDTTLALNKSSLIDMDAYGYAEAA